MNHWSSADEPLPPDPCGPLSALGAVEDCLAPRAEDLSRYALPGRRLAPSTWSSCSMRDIYTILYIVCVSACVYIYI